VVSLLVTAGTLHVLSAPGLATGTPACTEITNRATATYNIGGAVFVQESNAATTTVVHVIDVSVVWQDAAEVVVAPGDTNRALTFLVTNTGNADDTFSLAGLSTLAGDDFDPVLADIYLDSDGDGLCDVVLDERYAPGTNDPFLASDASIIVFVLNDIPDGLADGSVGDSELSATSNTANGPPGTIIPGGAPCDADAMIGASGGRAADVGTYIVSSVTVGLAKSATVLDPYGGSVPMPGAVIQYALVVSVSGTGTAEDLTITDPIPANTTYESGSLTLDGVPLTDEADGDEGDVGATTPGTVTVALGDVPAPSPVRTITFDVIID
jgi:uncharacterized repeat protein (TIGR01451 family)